MTTSINVDAETMAHALALAEQLHIPVEEVISQALLQFKVLHSSSNNRQFIGRLSNAADVLDEIVEEAYATRETTPMRLDGQ